MGPLAVAGLQFGGGLIANALFGRKKKQQGNPYAGNMQQWDRRVATMGDRGEAADADYMKRIQSFDPMAAATAASQAQYNLAMPKIQRAIGDLRGSQVGTGRLNSGYGHADQDILLSDNLNNLNQSMIARAMEAANMQMANNQAIGNYANDRTNMYLDATYGRYATEEDRRAAEAASKRGMWGNLLGAGINAFGQYATKKWGG